MYAFLCKPVPIALPSGNTAIRARDCRIVKLTAYNAVSYTHLTLPTKRIV